MAKIQQKINLPSNDNWQENKCISQKPDDVENMKIRKVVTVV
jgi:hypothetical protein